MQKLLKFRYFFLLLLILSCKEATNTETNVQESPDSEVATTEAVENRSKIILFYGNSLTAGYGIDLDQAFPALIQKRLDSLGLDYTVINSGVSGETTSGGLNRLNWVLNQKVDVFVLELGANDGLRGVPLKETKQNLQEIIDLVREKNSDTQIILAGMQIPPNMGPEYTEEFRNIFPELAEKNEIPLIPFLLEGVAGNPDLNLEDGIHPTAEGHKILSENVWKILSDEVQ